MSLEIRKLRKTDDRSGFSSGDIEIDRFFIKFAGQNQFKHKIGTTYIAQNSNKSAPIGYATVSVSSLNIENIDKKEFRTLPKYPLPILRLARLGVDRRYHGRGVGKALLRHILYLALLIEEQAGCIGIVVDAKKEAQDFYQQYGFEVLPAVSGELPTRPLQTMMYLSAKEIRKALP